jgi:hypothetical protein
VSGAIHATRFTLGEKVWIRDAEVCGRVKKIIICAGSVEFLVNYFDDDKVMRSEWFEESEIRTSEKLTNPDGIA